MSAFILQLHARTYRKSPITLSIIQWSKFKALGFAAAAVSLSRWYHVLLATRMDLMDIASATLRCAANDRM